MEANDGQPGIADGGDQMHHDPMSALHTQAMLQKFWQRQEKEVKEATDFKSHQLPLARIKKIMKSDDDVQMISAEAPVIFAKACEFFVNELTLRSWMHTQENKRRTLQRNDIAMAVTKSGVFDFLIDIVPREDVHTKAKSDTMLQPEQVQQYYLQLQQAQLAQAAAAGGQLGLLGSMSTSGVDTQTTVPRGLSDPSMFLLHSYQQQQQQQQQPQHAQQQQQQAAGQGAAPQVGQQPPPPPQQAGGVTSQQPQGLGAASTDVSDPNQLQQVYQQNSLLLQQQLLQAQNPLQLRQWQQAMQQHQPGLQHLQQQRQPPGGLQQVAQLQQQAAVSQAMQQLHAQQEAQACAQQHQHPGEGVE